MKNKILLSKRTLLALVPAMVSTIASAQLCIPPVLTLQPLNSTVCVGSVSTFTVVGIGTNLSYQWQVNTGSGFVNVVNGGAYSGALTAALSVSTSVGLNGNRYRCKVYNSCGTLFSNSGLLTLPIIGTVATPSVVCQGATVSLSATGGLSYLWSTGATSATISVTPATNTTYSVTGTTILGCTSTSSVTVTVNPSPNVTAAASPQAICQGSSSVLTASGANTYRWSTGQTGSSITVTPTSTTTYSVTGTNSIGCSKTVSVTVTVNPLPNVSINAAPPAICAGASSVLTASGATTYAWSSGQTGSTIVVSPASMQTYTVTGTSAAGCTKTASKTVTVNPSPQVTASASPGSICGGSVSTLTAQGGAQYVWSTGQTGSSIQVSPASTTTYQVTGTNAAGCQKTASVTVTVNPAPQISVSATDPTLCAGGFTFLTASGAVSYVWSTGETGSQIGVSPSATTTYQVTGTNANGCSASALFTVTVGGPTIAVTATDPELCAGEFTFLTASGASTYTWSTGETGAQIGVTPTATTTYEVTGTDDNGCSSSALFTVTVIGSSVNIVATDPDLCPGGFAFLTASGATEYVWSTGETGSQIGVSPSTTTSYEVTGTSSGCSGSASITITVGPIVTVTASDPNLCPGGFTFLNASGASTYLWSTGETGPQIGTTLYETSTYSVTGTNADGSCSATAEITVNVDPNCTTPSGRLRGQVDAAIGNTVMEFSSEELALYPNPTKGIVYIKGGLEDATIEVLNVMGQKVYTGPIGVSKEVDLTSYANGLYFVRFKHKGAPIFGTRVRKE